MVSKSKSKSARERQIESVCRVLELAGFYCARSVKVRSRLGYDRDYIVDVVARDEREREVLVKVRWQATGGTTEAKVPFDVICLAYAKATSERECEAYLVLSGPGWKLKDYYLEVGLEDDLRNADLVKIVALEEFVALANAGTL